MIYSRVRWVKLKEWGIFKLPFGFSVVLIAKELEEKRDDEMVV